MTWENAQTLCRQRYTDLATISSHGDLRRLEEVTAANNLTSEVWIGLNQTGEASWMWSVGETETSEGSAGYTNWATSPNPSHHCGGMRADGKWLSVVCDDKLPFACQEDKDSGRISVVPEKKSWREAQEYCRQNLMDLASARSQSENQALQHRVEGSGSYLVWMGLFRDAWKWSDRSSSSFRWWGSGQPNKDGVCVLYRSSENRFYDRGCSSLFQFYCYNKILQPPSTGKRVHRYIVQVELKSNLPSSFSYPSVRDAVLMAIRNKTGLANLQWRVQSDGKVFHKKEKKEETDEECEET
ncbi:macrophage mannose receptor 1-like [Halichoeres trimaculatus]|uniref:macrophage mannose receptor 1-like n=1 Tax=Halichoeres trimaculatus TaxID=147232 RepID=UPI003D9DDF87